MTTGWRFAMACEFKDQDMIERNLELFLEDPPFPLTPKILCEVLGKPNFLQPVWRRVLEVH